MSNHAWFFVVTAFVCNAQKPATDGNEGPTYLKKSKGEIALKCLCRPSRHPSGPQILYLAVALLL